MKKLFTLCLSLLACYGIANAQSMIYTQDFESTYGEWTLNSTTSAITGSAGTNAAPTGDEWLVNNVYSGLATTPSEPTGITGSPNSNYLHMNCGTTWAGIYGSNDNYLSHGNGKVYIAAMTTPQVTTGFTNVYFSFWWLCLGDATGDQGNVYYSTNGGTTWTQITGVNFYGSTTWTDDSLHLAAFDNQASLEFAFTFTDANTGATDPEFGIDDISLYGTGSTTPPPMASFITSDAGSICQDSCMLLTSTSTGTPTSVSWSAPGVYIASPTSDTTTMCFLTAGTYSVTLTATNSGGSNSVTNVITVNPTPTPVITNAGGVLSVPNVYSSYQWYEETSAIAGATSNSYTVTTTDIYGVVVDSNGCYGIDTMTAGPTGIANISTPTNNYWLFQPNASSLNLNATTPLTDGLAITIYDATGREMLNDKWDAKSSTKQISGLSIVPGLYIVKLSNTYTSTVLKWLKP